MPMGQTARWGLGIAGGLGLALAGFLAFWMAPSDPKDSGPESSQADQPKTAAEGPKAAEDSRSQTAAASSLTDRAARLAQGDLEALEAALDDLMAGIETEAPAPAEGSASSALSLSGFAPSAIPALTEEQADRWLDDSRGLVIGFGRFGPKPRAQIVRMVGFGLRRFGVSPTPASWKQSLTPSADLLSTAMSDPSPAVRAESAGVVGSLWTWTPGLETVPESAQKTLEAWKHRLHPPVAQLMEDKEPGVRLAAIIALGKCPSDRLAAPALKALGDEVPALRLQVLNSFAHRRDLLSEDDILPRLFDEASAVAMAAHVVLRARGLTEDQVQLAKRVYSPEAEVRKSVIADLENRDDIDPIVWLVRLSHDQDASVRSEALKALERYQGPDAYRRVAEMAESDPSASIREAAQQILNEQTADLPPLPGSTDLRPKAN